MLNHYILPTCVFIVPFPQYTTNDTTKGEEAIVNKSDFPLGFPSTLLPSVLVVVALYMFQDNVAEVTHHTPATGLCCCTCHSPVLLLSAFTRLYAQTASSHLNQGHTAELPALQMPFSSGKLATNPLVHTV